MVDFATTETLMQTAKQTRLKSYWGFITVAVN